MEWRESRSSYRMWSTHGELFLPFAELQRRGTHRLSFFCPIAAATSKPLPLRQGRTNASRPYETTAHHGLLVCAHGDHGRCARQHASVSLGKLHHSQWLA